MDGDLVSLPADGRAAGMARAAVRERLRDWGLEELLDVVVLLTSELVANVIVHTSSAPRLRVDRAGGGVRVTVLDASTVPPRRHRHSAGATTGRGLELLQDLAADWGWDRVGNGKGVWFLVAAQPGPGRPAGPPEPAASPMGRYAAAPGDTDGTVTVRLLGVPVQVLAASREHHDGLMRECRLLALSGLTEREGVPARLADLVQALGVRYAAARARPDADFDRAVEQGLETVDLAYPASPAVVEGARRLQVLMDEADELCRAALLMTLPRSPVVRRFADWYVDQFVRQVAGRAATRWDGPLRP